VGIDAVAGASKGYLRSGMRLKADRGALVTPAPAVMRSMGLNVGVWCASRIDAIELGSCRHE